MLVGELSVPSTIALYRRIYLLSRIILEKIAHKYKSAGKRQCERIRRHSSTGRQQRELARERQCGHAPDDDGVKSTFDFRLARVSNPAALLAGVASTACFTASIVPNNRVMYDVRCLFSCDIQSLSRFPISRFFIMQCVFIRPYITRFFGSDWEEKARDGGAERLPMRLFRPARKKAGRTKRPAFQTEISALRGVTPRARRP